MAENELKAQSEEKNTKKKKRKIIGSIFYGLFLLCLASFIAIFVVVVNHQSELSSSRIMKLDGYIAFIEEEKYVFYPTETGNLAELVSPQKVEEAKEKHPDWLYELGVMRDIKISNRFWCFTDFNPVNGQTVYLGSYDDENHILDAGQLIVIKDNKGMYNYFYYRSVHILFYWTEKIKTMLDENPYISINGNDIPFENDYYFKSSINLLDEGLSLKVNGTSVNAYEACPNYYLNERYRNNDNNN